MALFGALGELPDKESAAVRAAQEITRTVRERAFGDLSAGEVDVGVGIATGTAFVGSIRAAGQKVWSAMGNTANYASRLESLTRDLDASIVLDGTTRDRSDSESAEFERHDGIPIKGREGAFSVYAAPLGQSMESSAAA
jgi:adenylate cyclase